MWEDDAVYCKQTHADTSRHTACSQEDTLTEKEASGPLSCLWMTVLIMWALSGPAYAGLCVRYTSLKKKDTHTHKKKREILHKRSLSWDALLEFRFRFAARKKKKTQISCFGFLRAGNLAHDSDGWNNTGVLGDEKRVREEEDERC